MNQEEEIRPVGMCGAPEHELLSPSHLKDTLLASGKSGAPPEKRHICLSKL